MTFEQMLDEARLSHAERRDWANNLERAILTGAVKRPASDAFLLRARLPKKRALERLCALLIAWRDRLPKEFIDLAEADGNAGEYGG